MNLRVSIATATLIVLASGCEHSVSESDRNLLRASVVDVERGGIGIGGLAEWSIDESKLDRMDSVFTQRQREWESSCQRQIDTIPDHGNLAQMKTALSTLVHCRARGDELLLHFISAAYRLDTAVRKRPPIPIDSLLRVTRKLLAEHDTLSVAWEVNHSQFNRLARSMDFRDTLWSNWMTRKEIVNNWFYILSPQTKQLLLATQ